MGGRKVERRLKNDVGEAITALVTNLNNKKISFLSLMSNSVKQEKLEDLRTDMISSDLTMYSKIVESNFKQICP